MTIMWIKEMLLEGSRCQEKAVLRSSRPWVNVTSVSRAHGAQRQRNPTTSELRGHKSRKDGSILRLGRVGEAGFDEESILNDGSNGF
jgi:hypothetical protein